MPMVNNLLMIVQVVSALGVIVLVLMQHGKGADMGAAFGSGSSGSLFGATGSANFLSRTTGVLATVFFVSTLALALIANQRPEAPGSIMHGVTPQQPVQPAQPAQPALPADVPPASGAAGGAGQAGAGQAGAGQAQGGQAGAGQPAGGAAAPAPVDDVPK